jgi:uncharacterized protein (UPF0248 family)
MILLEDLLHRIQWDPEFGRGAFALGYVDRVAVSEQIVLFSDIHLDRARPGMFTMIADEAGSARHIPLHRVRTVYKNGVVIWQRPAG